MKFNIIENNNDNILHSFLFSQQTKPYAAIDGLFSAFMPISKPLRLEAGAEFPLGTSKENAELVLLEDGICSFCHGESQIHITTIFAPSVVGLVDGYALTCEAPSWPQHYLLAETRCLGRTVSVMDFIRVANEQSLWHDVAQILAHRLVFMSARGKEMIGVDSYIKVRALLIEAWAYPEAYRSQISIMSFIQRRTGLSRSRILKILSELKKGGYIDIETGRLIYVRKLPLAY
ncbi:helix-turn-helix domain-containing protein [Pseudocitrobacter sp. Cyp-38S]|uniref:Helix-turn-helix domain-containing protein n=2 Tax=Pseudocitrobacter cyperus TaxID=3112843 RepID=A0ABV0HI50_9ENTR